MKQLGRQFGHNVSEETRKKISEAGKGRPCWNKGKHWSEETKEKMRKAKLGKKMTEETRKKISLLKMGNKSNTGRKLTLQHKENIKKALIGKPRPLSVRRKISESRKKIKENLWNWKGGITNEIIQIRNSLEMKLIREACFKRDNWICQHCYIRGGKLNAHHIKSFSKFPELRFILDNLITLCLNCHKNTDSYLKSRKNSKNDTTI